MTAACTAQAPLANQLSRVLLISGAQREPRTDGLVGLARELLGADGIEADLLDPSQHHAADVYEKWLFADAVLVIAPAASRLITERFQPPIERLARAGYPHHLAQRAYGVVVHGADADHTRNTLCRWFDGLGMIDADSFATLDRHLGYHEPSADQANMAPGDEDAVAELRSVARALARAVHDSRAGRLPPPERRATAF